MGWVLRFVEAEADSLAAGDDVIEVSKRGPICDIAHLGLTLAEAKQLLARVQQVVVAAQAKSYAASRPVCSSCNGRCHIHDWRPHQVATLFGVVAVRFPRFRCAGCGHHEAAAGWPSHCRSTPEMDQLQAHLSALMPYRVPADVMMQLLPVDAGMSTETLRAHTLKVGQQLRAIVAVRPAQAASAATVTLDSTFIRGCHNGERHLEVRVGNVETSEGGRQVFGSVARADTDIAALLRRGLAAVGRTADTAVTAFTDGCPGLRSILTEAGVTERPSADWFHIAMRLQHAKLAATGLSTDEPVRVQAKAAIIAEVERLRWRIWNGNAKSAKISLDRVGKVLHAFRGERGHRRRGVPSRKLWHALHEVNDYLRGQEAKLVNYAERYRAGLRVGTSVTEGTANFLINRRMNKAQQMRWSRRGADLLLQVRSDIYNRAFEPEVGNIVEPILADASQLALAA
jgi:hypothetical protein